MKNKLKLGLISFLAGISLWSCKSTSEIIYSPASANVYVLNDSSNTQQGAIVRVYDDINLYTADVTNGTEIGYREKLITDAKGMVRLEDLNTDKAYYFLVNYRDRARFVDLDNENQNFKFAQNLIKGSDSNIQIHLTVSKIAVSFYAPTVAQSQLPITIYIDNDSIGNVTNTSASAPTDLSQQGTINFKLSQGNHQYYAKSATGCIWTGIVKASAGVLFNAVPMSDCNASAITFYTDADNTDFLPIKITLNKSDDIGELKQAQAAPTAVFQNGYLSVAREAGVINYSAESVKSNCVWTGTINLGVGQSQIIKLTKCQ